MRGGSSPDSPLSIVCVCTGNVCRSPAAEQLLAGALGETAVVESVGTHALSGMPMAPPMRRLVGPDPRGDTFRARQLRVPLIAPADLILTMADEHTGFVMEEAPRALRRTFRLMELAWLLREVPALSLGPGGPVDRLQAALVTAAARRRPADRGMSFDVVDPYGRDDATYLRAYEDIKDAATTLGRILRPLDAATR